jgi:hypothetical protein
LRELIQTPVREGREGYAKDAKKFPEGFVGARTLLDLPSLALISTPLGALCVPVATNIRKTFSWLFFRALRVRVFLFFTPR